MLLTPSMQTSVGSTTRSSRSSCSRCGDVLEPEPPDGGAVAARHLAAVVHRLVRARVEEDRPAAGEHRKHRGVDVRDRRQEQRVLAPEQRGQTRPRSARTAPGSRAAATSSDACPRRASAGGIAVDDLRLEVEAEVVARREVGEPPVADADHPPVDLVDDGVHHRVGRAQVSETPARVEPAFEPQGARGPHAGEIDRFRVPL